MSFDDAGNMMSPPGYGVPTGGGFGFDPSMLGMMGLGGGMMSGLFGLLNQFLSFGYSQRSVQQQEQFQTQMANSAFSRARNDMINAGINPILAGRSPEVTPMGGSVNMQAAQMPDFVSPALSTAMQATRLNQELKTQQYQNLQQTEDIVNKAAQTDKLHTDMKNVAADTTLKLLVGREHVPEALKADIDAATYHNATVAAGRSAGTAVENVLAPVKKAVDVINPFISSAKGASALYRGYNPY
jgi:hypothetical protein